MATSQKLQKVIKRVGSCGQDAGGATLDEVAAELGVSRERARQIEREALAKLRFELERQGLSLSDLCPDVREDPPSFDD